MSTFADIAGDLFKPGETFSLCTMVPGGTFAPRPVTAGEVLDLPQDRHVWFGVNPVPAGVSRGREDNVTRWAALYADLDVKPGAFDSIADAQKAVNQLSDWLHAAPSFVIHSGNGLQPLWLLDQEDPETDLTVGDNRRQARILMRRWGVLVNRAAPGTDSVFDLARILRVPGTVNHKQPNTSATVEAGTGHAIEVSDLRAALDEWSVPEPKGEPLGEVISPPTDWKFGAETCSYIPKMVNGWDHDLPTGSRHHWALNQLIRLAAARRAGCITRDDYLDAHDSLTERYDVLLATHGEPRKRRETELQDMYPWAIERAATMTDEEVAGQLGNHPHREQNTAQQRSRRAVVTMASEIRSSVLKFFWENRIPTSTISLLAGRGGEGKSTFAFWVAAEITKGTLPGEYYGKPQNVLIWSGEDEWSTIITPRLDAAGADRSRIGKLDIAANLDQDTFLSSPNLPADLPLIEEGVEALDAKLVILDPLASVMEGDVNKEADVRRTLDGLARIAHRTGAVILGLRHFNKGTGSASNKMTGSHAFRDAARSVFLFAHDTDSGHRIVTQDKGNYSPKADGSFAFTLEPTDVPIEDGGTVEVPRVMMLGDTDLSVEEIINRDPAGSGRSEAQRFILDYLKDQPGYQAPAGEVIEAGVDAGIQESTLRAARSRARNPKVASIVSGAGRVWKIDA